MSLQKIAEAIDSVRFIPLTAVVPKSWDKWFFNWLSEGSEFTWGSNEHSLVEAERLAKYCEERLDDTESLKRFLNKLRSCKNTYIDLES